MPPITLLPRGLWRLALGTLCGLLLVGFAHAPEYRWWLLGAALAIGLALLAHGLNSALGHWRQLTTKAQRLETLLTNMPGMAYRCKQSPNWPMLFVSQGSLALCGYQPQALERQQILWGQLLHPDDLSRVERHIQQSLQAGRAFELEYRILTRIGELKWVWERGRMVGAAQAGPALLEGFITDITGRKLAEQALRRARAFSKSVLDAAVEAVITVDAQGRIESINRATRQLFWVATEHTVGRPIGHLLALSVEASAELPLSHALETDATEWEAEGRRADGQRFPIHVVTRRIAPAPQARFVVLIRDLSRRREAERLLRAQREQLAHLDRLNTLAQMATAIAHELNQPLTAIASYASAGQRLLQQDKAEALGPVLDKLHTQAHRAGAVIERVQQLSAPSERQRQPIDAQTLLTDTRQLAEVEAQIRDIQIRLRPAATPLGLWCDPIQIQQVVLNLLRNGMQSMCEIDCRHGRQIELYATAQREWVEISVRDSGRGLIEREAQRLYQPFSTDKSQGMGMGLSISQSIVQAHGGKLAFENNADAGARFYFTLPSSAVSAWRPQGFI